MTYSNEAILLIITEIKTLSDAYRGLNLCDMTPEIDAALMGLLEMIDTRKAQLTEAVADITCSPREFTEAVAETSSDAAQEESDRYAVGLRASEAGISAGALQVLEHCHAAAMDSTGGEFGFSDEAFAYVDGSQRIFAGLYGVLCSKGLINSENDVEWDKQKLGTSQFTLTEEGCAILGVDFVG